MAPSTNANSNSKLPSLPEEQWAQVVMEPGQLKYGRVIVRKPGPNDVLINIKYSGVCHTDLHAMLGDWPVKPTKMPLVGGHEGAGVVVALGENVDDIKLGDHVGVKWLHSSCLKCTFCLPGDEPLCPHKLHSGYNVDGSFQQYCVAKAAHVARIPRDLDLAQVAPILCAGVTVYKGLKESGAKPGQDVVVVGAGGGLGHLAMQYAKAMGLRTIAVDIGEDKRRMCMERLGAARFIDAAKSQNLVKEVMAASLDGYGPHAALIVSSAQEPYKQAWEYVRPRGCVMAVGLAPEAVVQAPLFWAVNKMITLKGSVVGNRQDTAEAIEFFRRGLVKVQVKTVGLSELDKVYKLMEKGMIAGRYVLDMSK